MSTITTRHPQHHHRKRWLTAALGAALGLAVAAGIGAWQRTQPHTGITEEAAVRTAPAPLPRPGVAVPTADREFTVYLVASEEAGALVRGYLEGLFPVYGLDVAALPRYDIVVAASGADALRVQRQLDELDNVRAGLALPAVRRIDLRQPAAPPAVVAPVPPVSDQEMYQRLQQGGVVFILVASEAAAALERAALHAENGALAGVTPAPRQVEVVVVRTAEEEGRLRESAAGLHAQDGVTVTVIDRRP